jgi:hypothetical protein
MRIFYQAVIGVLLLVVVARVIACGAAATAADGHTHTFSITKPLVDTQTPY